MGIAILVLATLDAITVVSAEAALVSHEGEPEGDLDAAFTMTAIHGIIMAALAWLAAPFVARFFGVPSAAGLTRGLAIVPLLRGFANPGAALLVKRMEFRRLFWWGLPENIAAIGIVVIVGSLTHDALSLVAAAIVAQAVSVITSYAMWPRLPHATFSGAAFARLFRFAKWIQGTRVLMFIGLNLDNVITGKFLGAQALGIYQVAFRIGEIPVATLGRAAARVTLPFLASLRHDRDLLRRELGRIAGTVTAVTTGFALLTAVAAGPVVRVLLGESWLSAVPILRVLAVAMVFRGIIVIATEAFYAAERPGLAFLTNVVRVAVMTVTIYPLAKIFGTMGVALSVLICSAAAAVTCIWALISVFGSPTIRFSRTAEDSALASVR